MAYIKNTWVDQDVERPKTYEVTNNQDGSITLTDSFGLVTELGTPVNEVNMNHIEDGIDGCAIRKHNLTETFNLGEWVLGGTDDDEGIYKSLIDNNVGNTITDDTKWEKVEMGGSSRNIGEIVASTIPLTDAGLHLLDGSLLQYGIYQAFIDYIADLYDGGDYTAIFETEANWQTAVTTYGVCGKFVYDSVNNTVRLPKITGIVEGTTDLTALGDLVEAGLPSIAHTHTWTFGTKMATSGSGTARYGVSISDTDYQTSGMTSVSSIYGNSTTVQPQTIKVLYYIVIATSTKTDIEVDIDEIATGLNGKADKDLTNTIGSWSSLSKNYVITLSHELDWNNAITVSSTSSNSTRTYTPTADGMFFVISYVEGGSSTKTCSAYIIKDTLLSTNHFYGNTMSGTGDAYMTSINWYAKSGEQITYYMYTYGSATYIECQATFVPFKKS